MISAQDVIGLAITGILSLLWFDLRRLGKSKEKEELEDLKKVEEFRKFMFHTFLTRESHDEKCGKTLADVSRSITEMKIDILRELRNKT